MMALFKDIAVIWDRNSQCLMYIHIMYNTY